jgi:predicted nucleotidyltransferase
MAKKKEKSKDKIPKEIEEKIPKEVREKLMGVKKKLNKFKTKILDKFDKYITGIALLPPPKAPPKGISPEEIKKFEEQKDKFHVLILIDDTEPHKMSKAELKDKLSAIIDATAKETDPKIITQTLLLSELWQNCYDAKYDMLQLIAMAAPIHDTGMLAAIKISEVHKTMVLKKFEKYIVTYVLVGSLVQGRATPKSDIDVFIVIDDTDVKKMTRAELKDKLRAIIIDMGFQAGEMTGIKNKINIQVYILTDFWDSVKEANPVIFTFLRDGVPFFDRGIFMPWKQLLKMGKVKPSPEAIDMYMSSGEQVLDRVKFKLRDIGTEDFFWAILTPSQAALMLYGVPPPAPKETPELMRAIFVKKEKLLEEKDVQILENVLKTRKAIEHGEKKLITGKEIDDLVNNSEKYLKRLKKLFTQIERIKESEVMTNISETVVTVTRDVLRMEGVEKTAEPEIVKRFDEKLVQTGRIPSKFLRNLQEIMKAKKEYAAGKLGKTDVDKTRKTAGEYIKLIVEHMQRKRGRELERTKIRLKYGEKFGEVTILGKTAFIVRDITADKKEIQKAVIQRDGSLGPVTKSGFEELEKALAKIAIPEKVFIAQPIFESLAKIFGKDVEIMVT